MALYLSQCHCLCESVCPVPVRSYECPYAGVHLTGHRYGFERSSLGSDRNASQHLSSVLRDENNMSITFKLLFFCAKEKKKKKKNTHPTISLKVVDIVLFSFELFSLTDVLSSGTMLNT